MIKRFIQRWLGMPVSHGSVLAAPGSATIDMHQLASAPRIQVTVMAAANGHVLQVGVHKLNPHGLDWTYHLYTVRPDESIVDAISTCVVLYADR